MIKLIATLALLSAPCFGNVVKMTADGKYIVDKYGDAGDVIHSHSKVRISDSSSRISDSSKKRPGDHDHKDKCFIPLTIKKGR